MENKAFLDCLLIYKLVTPIAEFMIIIIINAIIFTTIHHFVVIILFLLTFLKVFPFPKQNQYYFYTIFF